MELPFTILRDRSCLVDNSECDHRLRIGKRTAKILWVLLVCRTLGVIGISLVIGGILALLIFPAHAQEGPTPAQVTIQQFEIQNNTAEIEKLRVSVASLTDAMATLKGIGIGLGSLLTILLILQTAQILLGRQLGKNNA